MISGAHVVLFSKDAEADRAFFRDVLHFPSIDAGHGWLIFALPPAEAAFHPGETDGPHELYLLCTDLKAEMQALKEKGVECSAVHEEQMGLDHPCLKAPRTAARLASTSQSTSWRSDFSTVPPGPCSL